MILTNKSVLDLFEPLLSDLNCQRDTKSYIIGIFGKYKNSEFDLSQHSVTLLFAQAREKQNFFVFQNIGDYLLFTNSVFPGHLKDANKDYYDTIARLSYYSCYRLINRQWPLYEELADQYVQIEQQVRQRLNHLRLV